MLKGLQHFDHDVLFSCYRTTGEGLDFIVKYCLITGKDKFLR